MAPCVHIAAFVGTALLTLPCILPIEGLVVRDHNSSHAATKSEHNAHRSGIKDGGPMHEDLVPPAPSANAVSQDHMRSTSSHDAEERHHHKDRSSADAAAEKRSHACLTGQRIVFIGPSTSKFDYLALAYFAEYGHWPIADQVAIGPPGTTGPNPLYEWNIRKALEAGQWLPPEVKAVNTVPGCNGGAGTETFMRYTNHIFNNHEVCDCHQNGDWQGVGDLYNSTENRVYTNGDTMLSYFQWFGDTVAPRGTVDVRSMLGPTQDVSLPCPVGQFPGQWAWTLPLPQFLETVVQYMNPSHLIISAAFWPTNPQDAAYWETIAAAGAAAVSRSGGQVYWRTTPQRTDHAQTDPASSVEMAPFLAHGWKVYDARAIVAQYQGVRLNEEIYYDFTHLKPEATGFLGQTWLEQNVCPAAAR